MERQSHPTPLILLTRPKVASEHFAAKLAGLMPGAEVMISPLQVLRLLEWQPLQTNPAALIFTSQNAVAAAARAGLSGTAFCVGRQTAEAAIKAGFAALSANGDADALIALIRETAPQGPLLHLRGRITRGNLARTLRADGLMVEEAVVYDLAPMALSDAAIAAISSHQPVLLPLFSPQSAKLAAAALTGAIAPITVLALSKAVAQAAGPLCDGGFLVARRPDADGMLEIVAQALNSGALS